MQDLRHYKTEGPVTETDKEEVDKRIGNLRLGIKKLNRVKDSEHCLLEKR